ncbi:MAG TPA: hypothetical protein DIS95_11460 [Proteus vulgaris]|jgi:hypothetical protein|nr:hypothetical protein EGX81_02605 [Proteus vulgaris]HCN42994.1 hypothetical protein [Proteus vulgaris]
MNSSLFAKKRIVFYDKTRNKFIFTANGYHDDNNDFKLSPMCFIGKIDIIFLIKNGMMIYINSNHAVKTFTFYSD